MRKIAILLLLVSVLVLGSVLTVYAGGPPSKATGRDAAAMVPAVTMFGAGTGYDNAYQIPDAKGKVNMIQPLGEVDVILGVGVDGLEPLSQYIVYLDLNGAESGPGPWQQVGELWTDEYGQADWNYTLAAGTLAPGDYVWSVVLNRTNPGYTVLVSYDVLFTID